MSAINLVIENTYLIETISHTHIAKYEAKKEHHHFFSLFDVQGIPLDMELDLTEQELAAIRIRPLTRKPQ